MEKNQVKSILFFGAGEVADLAYLYLQLTPIRLAGIVDESKKGRNFFGHEIAGLDGTRQADWDMILVTGRTMSRRRSTCLPKRGWIEAG